MLTEFQRQTEAMLSELLESRGMALINREMRGKNEKYVVAEISGAIIRVWIYEDEAEISGADINLRFESPDYGSSIELMEDFIKSVVMCLDGDK